MTVSQDHAPTNTAVTSGQSEMPLRLCGYCDGWNRKPCGDGCHFSLRDPTWEQHVAATKAEDRPTSLDQVWSAVNVLGAPDTACRTAEDLAYCRGIGDALAEIEKLGGRSV